MIDLSPKEQALLKEILTGTLRALINQKDEPLIKQVGELLKKVQ